MAAFLVRNFEDKALLGLFLASNLDELWIAVDEYTDPYDYQYKRVEWGAFMFGKESDEVDFTADDRNDDFIIPLHPARPNYELHSKLRDGRGWRRFDYATEGHGMIAQVRREIEADERKETK